MNSKFGKSYKMFRNFLFRWVNKEFLVFLFFLALSSIFWLMMTLNETYEQEICVPAHLVNVPKNAVITTDIEDSVHVTVRDKGYTLITYMYGDRVPQIKINFNTYANRQGGYGTVSASELQKFLYQRLGGSSKIVSVKPDHLEFYFNYGQSKHVPVHLNGYIVPDKSYYLARTKFWPEVVTVYASRKILDSIKYISTEPLRIVNFADTVIREVPLVRIKGVKTVPSRVRVGLFPDIMTEESIEVPIRPINVPDGKVLRTFPSKVRIRFTVGASMFRNVQKNHFTVVADYNDIMGNTTSKCRIYLRESPHGVRNPHLEIDQVDYLVEQR